MASENSRVYIEGWRPEWVREIRDSDVTAFVRTGGKSRAKEINFDLYRKQKEKLLTMISSWLEVKKFLANPNT